MIRNGHDKGYRDRDRERERDRERDRRGSSGGMEYRDRGDGRGRGGGNGNRGYDRGGNGNGGGNGGGHRGGPDRGNGGGGGGHRDRGDDRGGGDGGGNGGGHGRRREREGDRGGDGAPEARRARVEVVEGDEGGDRGGGFGRQGERGARASRGGGGRRERSRSRSPYVPPPPVDERFDFVKSRQAGHDTDFSKQGKSGTTINLTSNYFVLRKRPAWKIYHYHVSFDPVQPEKNTRDKVTLVNVHRQVLGAFIFDGAALWTFQPLELPLTLYSAIRRGQEDKVAVNFQLVAELEPNDVQCLQVYNVVMRNCFQLMGLDLIGRNYFDGVAAIPFYQGRFELWPGFVTTIRNYERGLMLNVEIAHRLLRKDTALEIMDGIAHNSTYLDRKREIKAALAGSTVMTSYKRIMYKIHDIKFEKTPASTFKCGRERTEVSYAEYYMNHYQIRIRNMRQPLLASRPKKKDLHRGKKETVFLIPELCQMTGITEDIRGNYNITREMGTHTHQAPGRKQSAVQQLMDRMLGNPKVVTEMESWGLEFSRELVSLPGRSLPPVKIKMEPDKDKDTDVTVTPNEKGEWTKQMRDFKMYANMGLAGNWILLVSERDRSGVDNLIRTMRKVGDPMGFNVMQPLQIIKLNNIYSDTYVDAIKKGLAQYQKKVELVFVILPNDKLELYSAIKRFCAGVHGVNSQCFLAKHLSNQKGLMSIATKVVIQMNAKMGGEPWRVANPFKGSHLMIIGYDIHHPAKRGKGDSYGAMVSTTNKELSRFYSSVNSLGLAGSRNADFSANMCADIMKAIDAYAKRNDNNYPDRIILFRDGVGDGQLRYVYSTELEAIKECLKSKYDGKTPPKFTFIVVTKKINTRLFTAGRTPENPAPGTIVDDVITLPERFDFYLISQTARQGTVSPTAYNVIWDQQGLDADRLQKFAYKLTHMYFNWSGTVSVPAVCQYARKLAYLTGTAMSGQPMNPRLCEYLYYL